MKRTLSKRRGGSKKRKSIRRRRIIGGEGPFEKALTELVNRGHPFSRDNPKYAMSFMIDALKTRENFVANGKEIKGLLAPYLTPHANVETIDKVAGDVVEYMEYKKKRNTGSLVDWAVDRGHSALKALRKRVGYQSSDFSEFMETKQAEEARLAAEQQEKEARLAAEQQEKEARLAAEQQQIEESKLFNILKSDEIAHAYVQKLLYFLKIQFKIKHRDNQGSNFTSKINRWLKFKEIPFILVISMNSGEPEINFYPKTTDENRYLYNYSDRVDSPDNIEFVRRFARLWDGDDFLVSRASIIHQLRNLEYYKDKKQKEYRSKSLDFLTREDLMWVE